MRKVISILLTDEFIEMGNQEGTMLFFRIPVKVFDLLPIKTRWEILEAVLLERGAKDID